MTKSQPIRTNRLQVRSNILNVINLVFLLATPAGAGEWKPHEVQQINGPTSDVRLLAQFQVVPESWSRVVAVPYLACLPEKDRPLMRVRCD